MQLGFSISAQTSGPVREIWRANARAAQSRISRLVFFSLTWSLGDWHPPGVPTR